MPDYRMMPKAHQKRPTGPTTICHQTAAGRRVLAWEGRGPLNFRPHDNRFPTDLFPRDKEDS